ncbi:Trans-1,2-dihydrobenzene-1,2-diol dehydrogenase-like protein [Aphelenchoides fujianensis]|nr:Trans-1,2-dihydrobenzene-1,2-diol dehydrogenase-like protein [Aphelenchoides fujianensis]
MIQKANSKRLFLMEGFWSRFFPAYQQIRHTIDTNELGRPRLVHAALGYSLPPDFVNLDRGETMLTTLGCYTVMLSSFVFGAEKPQRISYTGEEELQGRRLDLMRTMSLTK